MYGYALESQGEWTGARQAYEQVVALWQGLAQTELPLEAVAGLVRRQAEMIPDPEIQYSFWHNITARKQSGDLTGFLA